MEAGREAGLDVIWRSWFEAGEPNCRPISILRIVAPTAPPHSTPNSCTIHPALQFIRPRPMPHLTPPPHPHRPSPSHSPSHAIAPIAVTVTCLPATHLPPIAPRTRHPCSVSTAMALEKAGRSCAVARSLGSLALAGASTENSTSCVTNRSSPHIDDT